MQQKARRLKKKQKNNNSRLKTFFASRGWSRSAHIRLYLQIYMYIFKKKKKAIY